MKEEQARWVAKSQAVQELGVSLSTLDRRIREGRGRGGASRPPKALGIVAGSLAALLAGAVAAA